MIELLAVGAKIQPFSLVDDEGTTVSLPNGRPTLLVWDPKNFAQICGSCVQRNGSVAHDLFGFNADLYGVNFNPREQNIGISLFEFDNKLRILTGTVEVAKMFGVYREGTWSGIPHRAAFLIDGEGVVVQNWLITDINGFRGSLFKEMHRLESGIEEAKAQKQGLLRRALSAIR